MEISISQKELSILPRLVKSFLFDEPEADFLDIPKNFDNVQKQIELKSTYSKEYRNILANELENQYSFLSEQEKSESKVWKNIQLLRESNTYTLTTGQQIHIFLGPMYVPHKILCAVSYCEKLRKERPEYNFIPVFWMATEDHDFEEIRSIKLWNKEFVWEEEYGGATGELSCRNILKVVNEIKETFNLKPDEEQIISVFENYYSNSKNLAEATTKIVNHFFAEYGVISMDSNRKVFKELFKPYMIDEIENQTVFNAVNNFSEIIKEEGFATQIGAMDTPLFYLGTNSRERIDRIEKGKFKLSQSERILTKEEIIKEIENSPEKFSPNVSMRPLYQEVILPNLAYFGGAGEVSYWFQLKEMFDKSKVPYPILITRKTAVYLSEKQYNNWKSLRMEDSDLLISPKEFEEILFKKIADGADYLKVEDELDNLINKIIDTSYKADSSSVKAIKSQTKEWKKDLHKHFESIEEHIKKQNENNFKKAQKIHTAIFPEGILQERILFYIEFLLKMNRFLDTNYFNENQSITIVLN